MRGTTAPTSGVSLFFTLSIHGQTDNLSAFLSYLRLSVYMAIVSVAITLSFHLKHQPSKLELRMAMPLGAIFWVLAVLTLSIGVGNYISEGLTSVFSCIELLTLVL